MNKIIQFLILLLSNCPNENKKAVILQNFISTYGPIPDEYGDVIREKLRGTK